MVHNYIVHYSNSDFVIFEGNYRECQKYVSEVKRTFKSLGCPSTHLLANDSLIIEREDAPAPAPAPAPAKKRGRPSSGRSNRLQLRASDDDLEKISYLSDCFLTDSRTDILMRCVDIAYNYFRSSDCFDCPHCLSLVE